MSAPAIGTFELPDHRASRPVSSFATPNQDSDGKHSDIHAWDDDGPSFSDVLDIINPLQHIPIVNTIYRHLTGDTEGAVADVVGGTLYGGPIGLGLSLASLTVQDSAGQAPDDYVYARLFGDDGPNAAVASNRGKAKSQTAAAEDDAPPPPASVPRDTITTSSLSNGSVKAGDYLVFGGSSAGSTLPQATLPQVAQNQKQAESAMNWSNAFERNNPTNAPASSKAASVIGTQQGDYLVFGGTTPSAPPTNIAPPASVSANIPTEAPSASKTKAPSVTAMAAADPTSMQDTLEGATRVESHLMPLPARRPPSTPPSTLPLPTTGPAAVGGKSQAIHTAAAQNGNVTATNDWFAQTVNQNMDKYDSMHAASSYDATSAMSIN